MKSGKPDNTVVIAAVIAFALTIVALTVLIALNKPVDLLIAFLAATVIPSVMSTVSAKRSGAAADQASEAANQASTAAHNTNGRMTELTENQERMIAYLESTGAKIDEVLATPDVG